MTTSFVGRKGKCSLGTMNTMYLSEMTPDREDTVFHMQCAGSVAAPKKAMTKAQKNKATLEAFNAGRSTPTASKKKSSKKSDDEDEGERGLSKSLVVQPTSTRNKRSDPQDDDDSNHSDDDDKPKSRHKYGAGARSKSMIDRTAASLETMYLAEMKPTQADDVILLQCAGSVAAPKKAMTKAQKNKAAIEAYNAKVAARKAAK